MRHAVTRAELVHQIAAFDAQPGLQRAGRIVDAGMDDAAVMRAGVHARAGVPLEDTHRRAGRGNRARGGEAGHTGADHGDINLGHVRNPVIAGRAP